MSLTTILWIVYGVGYLVFFRMVAHHIYNGPAYRGRGQIGGQDLPQAIFTGFTWGFFWPFCLIWVVSGGFLSKILTPLGRYLKWLIVGSK